MKHSFSIRPFHFKMHYPYFLLLYLVVPLLIGITESVGTSSSHRMADLPQRRSMVKRDLAHQCVTPVCKESTAKMLHFINYNADPCEEFHEYVCGNEHGDMNSFSANNVGMIESYLTKINKNQSNKYLLDFQAFYRSCVNYDSTFNFMENMKFIKKYTSTNLTGVFTELILTQSMPFFDIGMDIQNADGSYMFQITLPGMSTLKTDLEDWSVFEQVEKECEHIVDSSIFAETLDLKLLHESFKECRRSLLMKYSRKYNEDMQFALKSTGVGSKDILKELLESLEAMRVPDDSIRSPPIMSIKELSDELGVIEWTEFFRGITTNTTFTGDENIQVHFLEYLKIAFDLMKKYDERGLVEILQEFSSFQLYRNFFRVHENKNIFCMDLSQQLMPDIATMIQYELKDPNENFLSIYHSQKIFDEMKEILSNSLENSTLDDSSKEAFQEKLSDLKLGLITSGNTENTWDGYKDVFVSGDYRNDVLNLLKNYRKMIFSLVKTKSSAASLLTHFVSPLYNSPKTFYSSNFVVLHPVLFDRIRSGNPEYFEVAKLGLLLAQEIAKHFDPSGRLYRSDDSLSNDAFYNSLMERTHNLLITYYLKSDYSFHGRNLKLEPINGTIMLNELIADNTAFRMVTDYLGNKTKDGQLPWIQNNFDVEQIVFIAAAQEFCGKYSAVGFARDLFEGRQLPFPIKIQNMISNSESFSMAFECPEGSSMTLPFEVITQFPHINGDTVEYESVDYENDD